MRGFEVRRGVLATIVCVSVAAAAKANVAPCIEDFPNVGSLPFEGWSILNASQPIGPTTWHQGDADLFQAAGGAPDSYAAADSDSSSGAPSMVSVWLVTPDIDFGPNEYDAKWIRFETRALPGAANRLVVRQCQVAENETCDPPPTGLGGFDRALLDINPDLNPKGYPFAWTIYTITPAQGLLTSGRGRIAFHYVLFSAPDGSHGSTIGLDSVIVVGATTCPFGDAIFVSHFE